MLWLVCFDMDLVCIINVLSGHIISYFKGLTLCTSLEENWFTCKVSDSLVLWLVSLAFSKRKSYLKGLTNKLYAYALVWKKTGLHAKFQVHWCYG